MGQLMVNPTVWFLPTNSVVPDRLHNDSQLTLSDADIQDTGSALPCLHSSNSPTVNIPREMLQWILSVIHTAFNEDTLAKGFCEWKCLNKKSKLLLQLLST